MARHEPRARSKREIANAISDVELRIGDIPDTSQTMIPVWLWRELIAIRWMYEDLCK